MQAIQATIQPGDTGPQVANLYEALLVLLERGRIVAQGTAEQMRGDPRIAQAYLGSHHG